MPRKGATFTREETRQLADCPMSYEEWIALMKEKNLIVEEENER